MSTFTCTTRDNNRSFNVGSVISGEVTATVNGISAVVDNISGDMVTLKYPPGVNSTVVINFATDNSTSPALFSTDASGNVTGLVGPDGNRAPISYILAQSAIPRIIPSSGSSNASGQITLTTALPYTPSGTVQVYLPAGVVTAGSTGTGAGLYPVIFSSTTVCQIQGSGIVTANGAYTQTTATDITLASVVVPGGAMGANGGLRIQSKNAHPNNANVKLEKVAFAANLVMVSGNQTTNVGYDIRTSLNNRGSQSLQLAGGDNNDGGASFNATHRSMSVDTSVNQPLTFTGQLAVATDYIILEGYTVEVLPMA